MYSSDEESDVINKVGMSSLSREARLSPMSNPNELDLISNPLGTRSR